MPTVSELVVLVIVIPFQLPGDMTQRLIGLRDQLYFPYKK